MIAIAPLVICLVASSTFSFEGDSEYDFVHALSKHLQIPVVLRAEQLTSIKPIHVTYSETEQLSRTILSATGLVAYIKKIDEDSKNRVNYSLKWVAVYRDFYDSSFTALNGQFRRYPDDHNAFVVKSRSSVEFNVPSGHYFSFRSDEEFAKGNFSVFPLYVRPYLIGHGTFSARRDFLDAAAKALGARVKESDGKLSIDFDYQAFREFVFKWPEDFPALTKNKEDAAYDIVSRRFYKECYMSLSEKQLRDGYEQPGAILELAIAYKSRLL
ncbi:hypothetical protein QPK87_37365 [Kamptonema cortianum]|nr:hypothetical protein [Geitlerinema splendidum]MDK3162178.1 hypothetical protein [Kamptonema cortianum]